MEDRECLFFGPHDRRTLVRLIRQLRSCEHGGPQHGHEIARLKQPVLTCPPAALRSAAGLPRDVAGRCADQTIAGNETMVEKRQRLVGTERGPPEGQPGNLYSRWIEIDAKQAALGYLTAKGNAIGGCHIRAVPEPLADQCRFGSFGELTARGDKEGTASHCRIEDAQAEDLIDGSFCDEGCQR